MPLRSPKRTRSLGWGLALLLGLAVLAQPEASRAQEAQLSIALLPVVVHSSESPDYLRRGLSDMLASRFEQSNVFRVIRIDDPKKATTQLDRALGYARDADADLVLFGSFTRFGAGASLDMQAAATKPGQEGETLREIFVHSGSIGDVIPDLEELVGKVARFAVADYRGRAPAGADPGGDSFADLLERVEALEREVEQMRGTPAGAE